MKGLIIKDFYNFKHVGNTYFAIALILITYCLITHKAIFVSIIPIIIFSMVITSIFTLDNKVKWEQLIAIGPLSRKDIVISKYVFLTIVILMSVGLGMILSIPNIISGAIKIKSFIELTIFSIDIALCSNGGLIACIYISRNLIEKMELLTLASYLWTGVILYALYELLNFANRGFGFTRFALILIMTVFVILIDVMLMIVAIKIFEKKDIC